MSVPTRFRLLRHAPVINPGGGIYGRNEIAVDTSNDEAFRTLARDMPTGAVWIVSPLSRTRATADAVRRHMPSGAGEAEPIADPDLIEQDFGEWCGRTHAEITRSDPEGARRFWKAPAQEAPPGGESFAAVTLRVAAALSRLGQVHTGRDVVVVTHGGVIRAALSVALGVEPERVMPFRVDILSTTLLDRFPDAAWRVGGVNLPPGRLS